jgi:hypothetical protein
MMRQIYTLPMILSNLKKKSFKNGARKQIDKRADLG